MFFSHLTGWLVRACPRVGALALYIISSLVILSINQAKHTTQSSLQLSSFINIIPRSQFTLILSQSRNWEMFRNSCLGKYHKAILYEVLGKELIFSRRVLILMSQVSSSKTSFSMEQGAPPAQARTQRQNLEIPC